MKIKQVIMGSAFALLSLGVLAEDAYGKDTDDDDEFHYAIGASVVTKQSLYVGGSDDVQIFPRLRAEWGRYFLQGPSFGAHLYQDDLWTVSASIGLDITGDSDRGDSAQLADMEELDDFSIVSQIGISYEHDWGEIELSFAYDISSTHDGYMTELSYGYPFRWGGWMIEPEVGVEWHSKEVNQYYYGVSAKDVRVDRPIYEPGSAINYDVGVTATYPFWKRHAIQLEAGYSHYSNAIADSPIVDRDNTVEFGVGYIFRF